MTSQKPKHLRVAISAPVKGTFFYAVPKGLAPTVWVGCRVLVPFNNRKVTAYVLEEIPGPDLSDQNLKEIVDILDAEPLFLRQTVPFFEWIADYYIHPIGMVIRSALPEAYFRTAHLTKKGLAVLDSRLFASEESELLSWIKDHPDKRLPWPLKKLYPLQKKGWLSIESRAKKEVITDSYELKFIRPKKDVDLETALAKRAKSSKVKNEVEFLSEIFETGTVLLSEMKAKFNNGPYLVNKWVTKGVLEHQTVSVHKSPGIANILPPPSPHTLNSHQVKALDLIKTYMDKGTFSCCLLYGVTGSGKTEVYYQAVVHAIKSGRQAILMAPEISLAGYLEGVFRSRLGDRIAVYHSGLSNKERYRQWMRMVKGEVDLVIGARSALFAPLPAPGLIIVDEEHDSAYVQEERRGGPHYQARDAAVVRAKMEKALVVLGSGTPSVQSFQNSITGKYHLILMPDRVERRPLPDVEIVDMKGVRNAWGKMEMISPRLRKALNENLTAGNQAILFLNRRGFHRLYLCPRCGQAISCPNCDVALTFHLNEDRLICHYCGFNSETKVRCPSCSSTKLKAYGFGTEKLEHELNALFPHARISRMDADSTRRKGEAFQILKRFGRHETDILVGTQMVTKGYDFPLVTLVGVISADLSLGFPDFRAGERTFQLLSQVAGRAGRGNQRGNVIIQTFNPDHYVVRAAMAHDFQSFFDRERELRKALDYPPFSNLACLRLQGNNKKKTEEAVYQLSSDLKSILNRWPRRGKEIRVLGPIEAPMARLKGKQRWQFLIKSRSVALMRHLLVDLERSSLKMLRANGVHLISDVDPYDML
ncbi:MAG: primosomal protein N' [Pseudomonadota bacterium]|nr:primosomal protein N' [Desulfobacterales bacterium]MBL7101321.1 primosomal protein N' [Desulfobacteraceae bacterium]MBL7171250.1 primosomal protein N' [Desulfobacteraceae bacterium]